MNQKLGQRKISKLRLRETKEWKVKSLKTYKMGRFKICMIIVLKGEEREMDINNIADLEALDSKNAMNSKQEKYKNPILRHIIVKC